MRISKSTKTSVKASDTGARTADFIRNKLIAKGYTKEEVNSMGLTELKKLADKEDIDIVYSSDTCNSSNSTDKALQHIKAAIDILGKSGNKDAVTKDSIANLGVVMLDIKANTVSASTSKCKYSKKECIDAIQYQYGMNKREADEYYKTADCKLLEALVDGFKGNAQRTFYND